MRLVGDVARDMRASWIQDWRRRFIPRSARTTVVRRCSRCGVPLGGAWAGEVPGIDPATLPSRPVCAGCAR